MTATVKSASSFHVDIHMAGDVALAGQVIQRYAIDHGMCVTLSAQRFIYSGGCEEGFRVGFINYPRFPSSEDDIFNKAAALADVLMRELGQHSYCIITPQNTVWNSRRGAAE